MFKNVSHKFYAVLGNTCPKPINIHLYKIKDTERKLVLTLLGNISTYDYSLIEEGTDTIITSGTSSDVEQTFIGLIQGNSYYIEVQSNCVNSKSEPVVIHEEEPPYNLKLLTDDAYLEVQNPALLDQLGGFYSEFVLDEQMTPNSSGLIRKYVNGEYVSIYNRVIAERLGLSYVGGSIYFLRFIRPVGATVWVETRVHNNAIGVRTKESPSFHDHDFDTYPVPTGGDGALLFRNMRVTILDLKIDNETFTKSSANTFTGDLGNIINVIGVEGTDYQWEMAI